MDYTKVVLKIYWNKNKMIKHKKNFFFTNFNEKFQESEMEDQQD